MIELSEKKEKELLSNMKKVFETNYDSSDIDEDSVKTYLLKWKVNKENIYNFLSKQKGWNKDELCLVIKEKVFRELEKDKAYNIIIKVTKTIGNFVYTYNGFTELIYRIIYSDDFFCITEEPKLSKQEIESIITKYNDERSFLKKIIDCSDTNLCLNQYLYSYFYCYCHLNIGMKKSKAICKMIDKLAEVFNVDYTNLIYHLYEQCKIRNEEGRYSYTYDHTWEQTKAKLCDYLNTIQIDEYFYISINPLDYLTMSHGDGWTSCHSLRDDGCYHAATISTLSDNSTVIIYTLHDKPTNNFYSYNKKSRQLMFMSEKLDGLFQQVFYPSKTTDNNTAVRNILQELISKYLTVPNLWENISWTNACINDSSYFGYRDWNEGKASVLSKLKYSDPYFKIGEEVPCLDDCYYDLENNDTLIRKNRCYCDHCGNRIPEEDAYCINDSYYCEECADELFYRCKSCGKYIDKEIDEYMVIDGDIYCEDCANMIDYVIDEYQDCVTSYYTLEDIDGDYHYYSYLNNLLNDYPNSKEVSEGYFVEIEDEEDDE